MQYSLNIKPYGHVKPTGTCGQDPMMPPFFFNCCPPFFSIHAGLILCQKPGMDRNYCLIVFIVYMSYSDTQRVAKCCLYKKKSMFKKKRGGIIGSCPHVPVVKPWHCYQSLNFSKFFCWLCTFVFTISWLVCVFTFFPVIKLIKDHRLG